LPGGEWVDAVWIDFAAISEIEASVSGPFGQRPTEQAGGRCLPAMI